MTLDSMPPGRSLPGTSLPGTAADTRALGAKAIAEARQPRVSGRQFWIALVVILAGLGGFAWLLYAS
ncbi:MAG: hypothetical protein H0X17_02180 [Deltaproteobacteria bacterium]|nr:hypothetical protein [Deltaproteobacteria bacterium]